MMKTILVGLFLTVLNLHFAAASRAGEDYVAHEWGTFTSVQGADGMQLEWNPLLLTELPQFVHDRTRPNGKPDLAVLLSKTGIVARQRLETPVIYFYSAKPRSVDVSVRFPSGTVTEWYPRETPAAKGDKAAPALRWANVEIVPRAGASAELPMEKSGSHYYAARETEADFVRVAADKERETEKFLFYRGVGNFNAPLTLTVAGPDAADLSLKNSGAAELRDLFVVETRADGLAYRHLAKLAPGDTQKQALTPVKPVANQREALAADLRAALVSAGLYAAEAAAMVKTWDDSWLGEPGVRVLYVLPRVWTDGILPLAITPAPRETVRVMVGRAEVITPPVERALATEIERFRSEDEATRATAVANVRSLGLGRFLEAALRRFSAQHPNDRELSTAGWTLLELASAPPAPPKVAAQP